MVCAYPHKASPCRVQSGHFSTLTVPASHRLPLATANSVDMSHEDRVPSISNPFDDPLTTSAQPGVEDRASATLSIGRNAQLTLGEDALHVFGM